MNQVIVAACVELLFAGIGWPQDTTNPVQKVPTLDSLKSDIVALKAAKVVWREIAWKGCLLEGLQESRGTNKPAAQLHVGAGYCKGAEGMKLYTAATARLLGEFRRTALALRAYGTPTPES